MPIYVYECRDCGAGFEVEQRISEDPLTDCRSCDSGTIRRIIQPTAVMFKGSGFYVNDSAGTNSAQASGESKAETKEEAAPAPAEAASSDSDD